MKVFFRGFLVVILVAFLAGSVYAEPTVKDLQSQLEKLMASSAESVGNF